MVKQVIVTIRVPEDEENASIKETIQIMSKHDLFKIPVSATIVQHEEFEELHGRQLEMGGKPIQNSRVREKLIQKIADASHSGPTQVVLTSLPQKLNEEKSEFGDM